MNKVENVGFSEQKSFPFLIGVSGKAGAGKDTVSGFICDWFCENEPTTHVETIHLADPLKKTASVLFGVNIVNFYDRNLKEKRDTYWGMTYREMLQRLGTESVRDVFGEDFWIDRFRLEIENRNPKPKVVIVPDIRFDNEAKFIRNHGGVILAVVRPDLVEIEHNDHASERGIEVGPRDIVLMNTYGLDELRDIVYTAMTDLADNNWWL